VRVNRATVQFEEAFARARIPYRVEEGGFLQRPAVAAAIRMLRSATGAVLEAVERTVLAGGVRPGETEDSQHVQDLETLMELAREYTAAHPGSDLAAFLGDLDERFSQRDDAADGRGVRLMTYHNAKGMEFDAVFLPRLITGELPYRSKRAETPQDEERRLLYVGITRARQHLFVTRSGAPSAFWRELMPPRPTMARVPSRIAAGSSSGPMSKPNAYNGVDLSGSLLDVLKRWRDLLYRRPQFTIFQDRELQAVAEAAPKTRDDLRIALGSSDKADKYALELLDLIGRKNAR
jgi:DNA helicase-2/ATP-dependent DNA helicase PcrA